MASAGETTEERDPWLVLVDEEDRDLGHERRSRCHDGPGLLHRAFSVYLEDAEGRLVIQQRAPGKRLWPGYWSNSCCGHPERGESTAEAAARRLTEELGVSVPLTFRFKYAYHASFGEVGSEREVCSVFVGRFRGEELDPAPEEVAALRLVTREELADELAQREDFTPWFRIAWPRLCEPEE